MRFAVLGGGAWGTALASVLCERGQPARLWCRDPLQAARMSDKNENARYLPGHILPRALGCTSELREALEGAEAVIIAVPVQHVRETLARAAPWVGPEAVRIGASKGIERSTLLRVSQVLKEIWGEGDYVVMSGPSFAAEVVRGAPTALTVAGRRAEVAMRVQSEMSTESFRLYTSDDVIGVELAGALKNVIAIAAGIVRGLGLGSNALAALLTRGLAEVQRLGTALGGRVETFMGLSGMGDLVLTSTGRLSRNERVGEQVAHGRAAADIVAGSRMVAEGVETARSAAALAEREGVEMPITREVVGVLFEGVDPRVAVRRLMSRQLKAE